MSHNVSKTFTELDTEDYSCDTPSEPTDFSAISNVDDEDTVAGDVDESQASQATAVAQKKAKGHIESNKITRQLLQRKQLAHDVQLLKIELSQKNLLIENMRAESMQREEELEERLADTAHQKQLLQARLESQLHIQHDDSKRRQDEIRREMDSIATKQRELEAMNARLTEKAGNVRSSLSGNLEISEDLYFDLRGQDESEISLRNFVAMKLYEAVTPLRQQNDQLRVMTKHQEEATRDLETKHDQLDDQLSSERQALSELHLSHQKLAIELADTKALINHGNYKIENYDKLKSQRDGLEAELHELQQKSQHLEMSNTILLKERDDMSAKVQSLRQTETLLNQDKDYFSKQLMDHQNRAMYADDKLQQLMKEVDLAKRAREDMYEKYANSRDHYKTEYETRLQEELEKIRLKTDTEIDRLKTNTREMYERENRNLRETRDGAVSERDRAVAAEREATSKYDQLLADFHQLQISGDNKAADLHNDLKIKSFELERTQMVYDDTLRTLKRAQQENEKLTEKAELVTKEFYQLQNTCDRKISELESMMNDKATRLDAYEKVEQELDHVVLQAAEIEDDKEAERVLFSYGYGANIPSNAKRRMKHSVDLARRVLQLERANTSLRKDVERERSKSDDLAYELKSANGLLDQASQPYSYLVESVRGRDQQLKLALTDVDNLRTKVRLLEQDKDELVKTKNQMSLDLERLLNQKEELAMMKQVVKNIYNQTGGATTRQQHSPTIIYKARRSPGAIRDKAVRAVNSAPTGDILHQPAPTTFTNDTPAWFQKLKSKNQSTNISKVYGTST